MHQPFLDWYDIWAGQACANENGESWLKDPPLGVRLAVQEARRSPVFSFARKSLGNRPEWRIRTSFWTTGFTGCGFGLRGAEEGGARFNGYAESRDGFEWERPNLGLVEYGGTRANNLLSRHSDFEINSVFIDPHADPEERYKAIGPKTVFYRNGGSGCGNGLGAVSPVGCRYRYSGRSHHQYHAGCGGTVRRPPGQCGTGCRLWRRAALDCARHSLSERRQ